MPLVRSISIVAVSVAILAGPSEEQLHARAAMRSSETLSKGGCIPVGAMIATEIATMGMDRTMGRVSALLSALRPRGTHGTRNRVSVDRMEAQNCFVLYSSKHAKIACWPNRTTSFHAACAVFNLDCFHRLDSLDAKRSLSTRERPLP